MTENYPRHGAQPGNAGQTGGAQTGVPQPGVLQPGVAAPSSTGVDKQGKVKHGMVSGAWVGLIVSALVLVLLIIFIAQNLNETPIHFFGVSGQFPIGLSLLIAAIAGVVLAGIPGTIRIFQLRRALRKATGPAGSAKKPRASKRAG